MPPKYDVHVDKCAQFFQNFVEKGSELGTEPKYVSALKEIAFRRSHVLYVEWDDIEYYFLDDAEGMNMADAMLANTGRYIDILSKAVDKILPDTHVHFDANDVRDVLHMHRTQRMVAEQTEGEPISVASGVDLPPSLMRRYEVCLLPPSSMRLTPLRKIGAEHIGSMVRLRGIVTRVSAVQPLIEVATYTCTSCGYEVYQEITSATFLPLLDCPAPPCQSGPKGRLELQTRGSAFVCVQHIHIQERPEEVPMGSIPRTLHVRARGSRTRQCAPGDLTTIAGIFLPRRMTGPRARRAGLVADTFLEAQNIEQEKKSYAATIASAEQLEMLDALSRDPMVFSTLAGSIAPEIWGHEDVKKALMLLMVGGCPRILSDGMRIRGDMHVCLMGDPGVAKSQLLKHVCSLVPRGVYTSGKGSSGVGLTAAVVRDPVTKQIVLEGGSLVLSDEGICAIDEFDKLDERDRTSIHEVMEQQTISIAKAGINTTLNARASIIAAANPAFGRYNPRLTPAQNINLPPALLSRFDLLFVLLDKPDAAKDLALAQHITHVHQHLAPPSRTVEALSADTLRAYIAKARTYTPRIPCTEQGESDVMDHLVEAYVRQRQEEHQAAEEAQAYTTARALLGVLRMAQALARIRFSNVIERLDVDEALRLVESSKVSLEDRTTTRAHTDATSAIFDILLDMRGNANQAIDMGTIEMRCLAKGFTQTNIQNALDEYERLSVIMVGADRASVRFLT